MAPPLFSTRDYAELKGFVAENLLQTATISRNTPSSDGAGGQTTTLAVISSNVPCMVVENPMLKGLEVLLADRVALSTNWRIVLPQGTDVKLLDVITVGTFVYEAEVIEGPETQTNIYVSVLGRLVQ